MKQLLVLKHLVFIALVILLFCNIFVFLQSIKLGDQINKYEKEINRLHQENLVLENNVYEVDSLQYASSMAASLNFTQKAEPTFLDELKYARNQ
ncbi:hypothetical protein A3C28_04910 [Candidatus Roizmanbacteria bacterium RIFCSPHIGHO2_02_FULL_39_9]|uniref:Cell division protein FtsL n=2 Tax=Candidatus Roizmaniibacteriota TaxID=1752723 RepID=A0A1F7HWT4_9BACT|nr:MAG: hypothetical protein A3C28_04910 [Candidatus Roizmanbacteria bacterium RIFCSPHIGHO2_02_FULL_39_9]OGK35601.1 MAG: hypothetical protein A3F60_03970 [Candidatus Roizmanbacteria bacterium RIFCSPHIGHO2_12_FULL_39_8]